MAETQDIELSRPSLPAAANIRSDAGELASGACALEPNISESHVPGTTFEDARPSRSYQAILIISGFLMIFQVMGLNSIYGVFQVYLLTSITDRCG